PLAIIRGESQVAISKEDRKPDEYRESLSIVHDESLRLAKIVEDLFTLARADGGQLKPQLAPVFLDEILMECVHAIGGLAKKRHIKIDLSAPKELKLSGDEALLHRMFLNLLDNAIKYNRESGSVFIEAKIEEKMFAVSIKDTGVGIAPEDRDKIFKRFYRADKARTRNNSDGKNGIGLGLSIAASIAEIHNGSLTLKRTGSEGSAFEVQLPRD
ncbi:MAG: HAMP domain-containing histidine kinase, partial [Acidobacteria bacterium]|nr:HAMP domain-containing histidine kinase [Acidobacteriota bacterium]